MCCTSCLSDDIQTRDQVSVPCTTPYFHKDTLTPPSSSRSPPLAGGVPTGPVLVSCPDPASFNEGLPNPPLKEARSRHETIPVRLWSRSAMHLYITHTLYFEIYTTLQVILLQLMSIAGYEAYVCVCFFVYKTICAAFMWLPWDARSRLYVCLYCAKKIFNT